LQRFFNIEAVLSVVIQSDVNATEHCEAGRTEKKKKKRKKRKRQG
jgi:hypothetical protein